MTHFKHQITLFFEAILISIPWLENADIVLKTASLLLGLIIGYFTIKKYIADLKIKDIERKIKEEELKKLKNDPGQ